MYPVFLFEVEEVSLNIERIESIKNSVVHDCCVVTMASGNSHELCVSREELIKRLQEFSDEHQL